MELRKVDAGGNYRLKMPRYREVDVQELALSDRKAFKEALRLYAGVEAQERGAKISRDELRLWAEGWPKLVREHEGSVLVVRNPAGEVVGVAVGHVASKGVHHYPLADYPGMIAKLGAGKHYYLRLAAVHPNHRRAGACTALLTVEEQQAKELGCKTLFGRTREDNEVIIRQLKAAGMKQFHTLPVTIAGETVNRIYYYKNLKQTAPGA